MDLIELLQARREEILMDADLSLSRSHLVHYDASGRPERQRRLRTLYNLVLHSVRDRELEALRDYVAEISQEQYETGSDLYEAQMALNVLEEAIWHQIIQRIPACLLGEAMGLVTTILSAAKDTLAQTYILQVCKTDSLSLNMLALFEATERA